MKQYTQDFYSGQQLSYMSLYYFFSELQESVVSSKWKLSVTVM